MRRFFASEGSKTHEFKALADWEIKKKATQRTNGKVLERRREAAWEAYLDADAGRVRRKIDKAKLLVEDRKAKAALENPALIANSGVWKGQNELRDIPAYLPTNSILMVE